MGKEFELKYRADDQKIDAIRDKFGEFTAISMETTYYGTADGAFGQRKWTLRRRYENGKSVCTLKTPGGIHARNEFEVEAPDIGTAIPQLLAIGAPEELAELTKEGVIPICGAKFTRLAKTLVLENCTVELALDRGYLTGGGKILPLCEVEAELKAGTEEAAAEFAGRLAAQFGLVPEAYSKFARALHLARV